MYLPHATRPLRPVASSLAKRLDCLIALASGTGLSVKGAFDDFPLMIAVAKRPGHYTIADWRSPIDTTWGPGLPKAQKLIIFDNFWGTVDREFACFDGIEVNWDSLEAQIEMKSSMATRRMGSAAAGSSINLLITDSGLFELPWRHK